METIIEIDAASGLVTERDFTAEEKAQRAKDQQDAVDAAAEASAKAEADALTRQAAIDQAKSLGFTDEMIALMYPNLAP
jgi:hypothetical protein